MSGFLPVLIVFVLGYGLIRRVPVFQAFCAGVKEGLAVCGEIFPVLLFMILSVRVFRASGAMELLTGLCAPLCQWIGLPQQLLPLILIRPLSGGGALSVCEDILQTCGADSFAGVCAAVLSGSTETTFYTVGLYLGGQRGRGVGKFLLCAVLCDLMTVWFTLIVCR